LLLFAELVAGIPAAAGMLQWSHGDEAVEITVWYGSKGSWQPDSLTAVSVFCS
jgi:hypothetical protein